MVCAKPERQKLEARRHVQDLKVRSKVVLKYSIFLKSFFCVKLWRKKIDISV